MTVDLCVVNYNTKPLLQRLVNDLHQGANTKTWRLYIADNGSTDGSVDWLEVEDEHPWFDIDKICFNDNIGYSAACNDLSVLGDSEFIGLLNSDVWLTGDDVAAIEQCFHDTGADIIGPKQRDEEGRIRHAGIFGTNTAPKHRGWAQYDPNDELYRDRQECVTVSGSAYFVRRSVWEALTDDEEYQKLVPGAVGAFLPTPHYYEETWCSYFARHRGYKVMYDGTVSIGHTWHASAPVNEGRDGYWKQSQLMFRSACDALGIAHD